MVRARRERLRSGERPTPYLSLSLPSEKINIYNDYTKNKNIYTVHHNTSSSSSSSSLAHLRIVSHVVHVEAIPDVPRRTDDPNQRDLVPDDVHFRIARRRPKLEVPRVRAAEILRTQFGLGVFEYQPLLAYRRLGHGGIHRPRQRRRLRLRLLRLRRRRAPPVAVAVAAVGAAAAAGGCVHHANHLPHEPERAFVVARAAHVHVRCRIPAVHLAYPVEAVRGGGQRLRAGAGVAGYRPCDRFSGPVGIGNTEWRQRTTSDQFRPQCL